MRIPARHAGLEHEGFWIRGRGCFQESLQKSIESPDDKELLATFRKAMDGMIAKYPESPTLLFLGGLAMQIEMTGATDTAKLVVDTVKSKADTVPAGDFRTQLDRVLGDASKRLICSENRST